MQASVRDRLVGGIGAAIVVALLVYLLLIGLIAEGSVPSAPRLTVLRLAAPPARQPRHQPPRSRHASRRPRPATPANLRNKATDVVAPPLVLLLPPPIIVAGKPNVGTAASSGASDRAGPGEGAGGEGEGTGGGGYGYGEGDGGVPPRQISGRLRFADLPPALREGSIGGTVGVRYRVEIDGRVGACLVVAPSSNATLDAATCALIQQHFRFRPSRDRDGRPVRSWIEESHDWVVEPADPTPPPR